MEALVQERTWHGLEDLRGALRSILTRNGIDENEADDVIQETYLRAARYRSNLSEGGRLRSWTTRIALNVLSDRKKHGSRTMTAPPGEGVLEVETGCGPHEELEPLYRLGSWELEKESALRLLSVARRELRDDDQRLLDAYYGGAQSCRETAVECDIPFHLVKVRLFRARRRLLRLIRRRLALGQGGGGGIGRVRVDADRGIES